jgi:ERCC4-related helicase
MNEIDPNELSKYLDIKYINARPDSKSLNKNQMAELKKDGLDSDNEIQKEEPANVSSEALVPREYQYELYQKAPLENVIVVLDTGMGKTLISTMLVRQLVFEEKQARATRSKVVHYYCTLEEKKLTNKQQHIKDKLAFFIVERVPLVFQQANIIRSNCNARVKELCGEMDVDKMSRYVWNAMFDSNDTIVLTAQVFANCLSRGFITIDRALHINLF